jgi:RNA polymerase sigma-B factor
MPAFVQHSSTGTRQIPPPGKSPSRLPGSVGEELAAGYARSRDARLRERTLLQYRHLVEVLAAKMTRRGAPIEDLIQVGMIGLVLALDRFDPDRGVRFSTYAVNTVLGEMKHFFRDCTWLVKVPRQLQEVSGTVQRANEELARELGRAPTITELAAALRLSEETIVEAMELEVVYSPYSLDSHLGIDDAGSHERLADLLGEDDPRLATVVEHEPLRLAMEGLEPRKKWILHRRYYDDWSQSEVGRALGISQMHVSRLEREALGELRRSIDG